jgi:hypothetical protein
LVPRATPARRPRSLATRATLPASSRVGRSAARSSRTNSAPAQSPRVAIEPARAAEGEGVGLAAGAGEERRDGGIGVWGANVR